MVNKVEVFKKYPSINMGPFHKAWSLYDNTVAYLSADFFSNIYATVRSSFVDDNRYD